MTNAQSTGDKKHMATKKRPHTDTTVPHIPADERDIVSARLRTPPPKPDAKQGARAVQLSEDDDEQVYICRLQWV